MSPKPKFQTPTGTKDILPSMQPLWNFVLTSFENAAKFYGFDRIDTPIIEDAELFIKGTGMDSDIVQKQMYNLKTRGGDSLVLRPEGTPPVVRAYLEKGMAHLPSPVKLYYEGPMFRYERPQAGRLRQFRQFGVEVIGDSSPVIDAEIIQLFAVMLESVKIKEYTIHINSIGTEQCRVKYKKILKEYYRSHQRQICATCRDRLRSNPLRVLDCKDEKCQRIKIQAPPILDYLDDESSKDFKAVLEYLDSRNLPYFVNPNLVRGLDYYTKTVFEIFSGLPQDEEEGVALGGGGRYDGLVKDLGGQDTPAVGFAIGMDRVINLLREQGKLPPKKAAPRIFLVQISNLAKKKSLSLIEDFRSAGINIRESLGRDSIKSQLNLADRFDVDYALILGHQEALNDEIIIREMESGSQETVSFGSIILQMKKRLARKVKKSKK